MELRIPSEIISAQILSISRNCPSRPHTRPPVIWRELALPGFGGSPNRQDGRPLQLVTVVSTKMSHLPGRPLTILTDDELRRFSTARLGEVLGADIAVIDMKASDIEEHRRRESAFRLHPCSCGMPPPAGFLPYLWTCIRHGCYSCHRCVEHECSGVRRL